MKAHGTAVGLPTEDDMGNSEVGHNALGAGRIYAQGYTLILAFHIHLFVFRLIVIVCYLLIFELTGVSIRAWFLLFLELSYCCF